MYVAINTKMLKFGDLENDKFYQFSLVSKWYRATIGPPAKRRLNGISLVCRLLPVFICLLGREFACESFNLDYSKDTTNMTQIRFQDASVLANKDKPLEMIGLPFH